MRKLVAYCIGLKDKGGVKQGLTEMGPGKIFSTFHSLFDVLL